MADLTHYYYERAGQPMGPLPAGELRAQGVQAATLVWQTGMDTWVPAGSVPGLRALLAPQPPSLPGSEATREETSVPPALPPPLPAPLPMSVLTLAPAAAARPQFSTEGSSAHPWWHFVLLAIFILFCLLAARACGVVLSRSVNTVAAPPSVLARALARLPDPPLPGGWAT